MEGLVLEPSYGLKEGRNQLVLRYRNGQETEKIEELAIPGKRSIVAFAIIFTVRTGRSIS
jgi:hypothetical protein